MTHLAMPVNIVLTLEWDTGHETRVLRPGKNLTDDGVQHNYDSNQVELRDGTLTTYTKHVIAWTEVEHEDLLGRTR